MKTIRTRFGEIEYDPGKTIRFPEGLIGFEHLRDFIVMPNRKEGPLFWIQSLDDPAIAFVLTDPTHFFLDYQILPDEDDRRKLGIGEDEECYVLSVVTVHQDKKVTLNLLAPLLFSPATNRAIQVVLEKSPYSTRHPLPS